MTVNIGLNDAELVEGPKQIPVNEGKMPLMGHKMCLLDNFKMEPMGKRERPKNIWKRDFRGRGEQ